MKEKIFNKAVEGLHGVTAEISTVQQNIDFEEGRLELDRGYIRFVLHPSVRQLEHEIAQKFNAPKALAFASVESAAFVLMDTLFSQECQGIFGNNPLVEKIYRFLSNSSALKIPLTAAKNADVIFEDVSSLVEEKNPHARCRIGLVQPENKIENKNWAEYDIILTAPFSENAGFLVFNNPELGSEIELLRRHTGYNLSSRKAERLLKNLSAPVPSVESELIEKLALLEKGSAEKVFLYPTGMGAISSAILSQLTPERPKLVMIGSPYVDTRCILEKWPTRRGSAPSVFLEVDDYSGMELAIDHQTAVVVCETPTNPLIRMTDLARVVQIAHQNGTLVLVDNTIASPYNLNPFDYEVDLIAHSTTKSLNGMNDHIGGVVLVRENEIAEKIRSFNSLLNLEIDPEDAAVLNRNLDTFYSRMKIMNENALKMACYLEAHPKVKQVWYSGLPTHPDFEMAKRYLRGNSSLLSFVLVENTEQNTLKFYDQLGAPVVKAPSLGASQSLLCLYVILAHYNDPPEKLAQMGLDKFLMRLSVGTENVNEIIQAFEAAFAVLQ